MNDNLTKILAQLGLEERESHIYLALLELGESTVLPIARQSGIQRTYCYDILASLEEQGLVSHMEKNGRRRYVAEPPETLERLVKTRLADLQAALPELKSLHNRAPGKPKVRYYDGREGLITIYEELLRADSLDAIASPLHIEAALGSYFANYAKKQLARSIPVRELYASDGAEAGYLSLFKPPIHEARPLPTGIRLQTDLVLYDNKLALISFGASPTTPTEYLPLSQPGLHQQYASSTIATASSPNPPTGSPQPGSKRISRRNYRTDSGEQLHAVVIEDSAIVSTHRMMFELLWSKTRG